MIPEPASFETALLGEPSAAEGPAHWESAAHVKRHATPPRESCNVDPFHAADRLRSVFSSLDRSLVGFEPLLIQAVYALLTRENLLVFSPAGTAKTLCAKLIFDRVRGARIFDTQMSKGTLADELFGSIDIDAMKHGRVLHNTANTLVDADFAFIDELFDANDMVLRALLGILNERVFKKGCQSQRARLHTGIAATNYLRATEVTEAVLDRFLLKAYIAPDYSPFTMLAIDRSFSRSYGRATATPADEQIPLEQIALLADIVQGIDARYRIEAPPHVLFLKNLVLNRFREVMAQSAAEAKKRPLYLSPRTYAKSRLVLNAAALMRGRMNVTSDDLGELRYVVTTVGGSEDQERAFDKALSETLSQVRSSEFDTIDQLTAAHDLAEQVMARLRSGEPIESSSFLKRLLHMLGLLSDGDLGFDHVRRFTQSLRPQTEPVKQLQRGVIERIDELACRVDRKQPSILF